MKNKITIIVCIIIFVIVGGALFLKKTEKKTTNKVTEAVANSDDGILKNNSSQYINYSKTALNNSANSRRVLFFYANWCSTCRPTDANFNEKLTKIPEDVVIIRVNYNDSDTDQEEKDLAKKYSITYQHTFVQIDDTGKEITKWNGGQLDELLANIK